MGYVLLKTFVERTIKEEYPEKIYSGEVKLGGVVLDVRVLLDLNLNNTSVKIPYLEDLRRIVSIEVTKDGIKSDFPKDTHDEYLTFFNLIVVPVLRAQKEERFSKSQKSEDYRNTEGVFPNECPVFKEVSMHNLSMPSVEILTSKKYGCKF